MRTIWVWAALVLMGCAAARTKTPATQSATGKPMAMDGGTILFDGKDTSHWVQRDGSPCQWTIENGAMVSKHGDVVTKEKFGDFDLHVEFWLPKSAKMQSLRRGDHTNSGVYLQGRYEIQILDSYGLAPLTFQDCGAIYHQKAPDVNACIPAERWQTMDIHFIAARYDASGKKTANARVTVMQNNIKIQDDQEILRTTANGDAEKDTPGPVRLQYHTSPVKFRNIRIKAL